VKRRCVWDQCLCKLVFSRYFCDERGLVVFLFVDGWFGIVFSRDAFMFAFPPRVLVVGLPLRWMANRVGCLGLHLSLSMAKETRIRM